MLRVGATGDEPGKPTAAARPRTHLPPRASMHPRQKSTRVSNSSVNRPAYVLLTRELHRDYTAY